MNDFWDSWEAVITELQASGKYELADKLKDSKIYLNGLTDGWHDFHEAAKLVINEHKD